MIRQLDDGRLWNRVRFSITHTSIWDGTRLGLSQGGTNKANHHQSTRRARTTSMRAIRQAWPCNFNCISSPYHHYPHFSSHYFFVVIICEKYEIKINPILNTFLYKIKDIYAKSKNILDLGTLTYSPEIGVPRRRSKTRTAIAMQIMEVFIAMSQARWWEKSLYIDIDTDALKRGGQKRRNIYILKGITGRIRGMGEDSIGEEVHMKMGENKSVGITSFSPLHWIVLQVLHCWMVMLLENHHHLWWSPVSTLSLLSELMALLAPMEHVIS